MFCDMCKAPTRCTCICDNKDSFAMDKIAETVANNGYKYHGKTSSGYRFIYFSVGSNTNHDFYYIISKCSICGGHHWKNKNSKALAHNKCRNKHNALTRTNNRRRNRELCMQQRLEQQSI